MLIVMSCNLGFNGEYIARELVEEQTLDNLAAFGKRIAETEKRMGPCSCGYETGQDEAADQLATNSAKALGCIDG